jgi:hypothetical protein
MKSLKDKIREWENDRRKIIIHDFKHLNCGECWTHRTNHKPTLIIRATVIGTLLLLLWIVGALFGHGYLFIPFVIYVLIVFVSVDWYSLPPHKRIFIKRLMKRTVD